MLRCSRSPNLQSNICRKITSQQKPCSLLLKFSAFECFCFNVYSLFIISTRHFLLELRRMAHIPFFILINYSLVVKVWSCTMMLDFLLHPFPFYTHSPPVPKRNSWKIYTLHISPIPKELVTKILIGFLRPCDIFDYMYVIQVNILCWNVRK